MPAPGQGMLQHQPGLHWLSWESAPEQVPDPPEAAFSLPKGKMGTEICLSNIFIAVL